MTQVKTKLNTENRKKHCVLAGGVTRHMTGYAPAYTKSVEKGSFLTYDVINVFCKKGIFFAANCTLGVPKWVELFAV